MRLTEHKGPERGLCAGPSSSSALAPDECGPEGKCALVRMTEETKPQCNRASAHGECAPPQRDLTTARTDAALMPMPPTG